MIPFTTTEFLSVFERYNNAIWPGQVVIYLLALIAFALAFRRDVVASKLISLILGFFWLWMGVVYHLLFFSTINEVAQLFGLAFIVQGMILIFAGIFSQSLRFHLRSDVQGIVGVMFIMYALIVYPVIGMMVGHTYPRSPTFGVPCPTTIFTLGLLLAAGLKVRWYMLTIPILWSFVGFWAAVSLGIYEDLGLAFAGLIAVWIMVRQFGASSPRSTPAEAHH